MTEYVNVRASETLDQGELVAFLKSRFAAAMRPVGRTTVEGTECVEVRVSSNSPEFEEIRRFIVARRKQGLHGFSDFTIDRKSTRLNSSHGYISYAVFCLKKKRMENNSTTDHT